MVNKRALFLAGVMTLCGWKLKATDTGYTMKVTQVVHSTGDIEIKFVTMPEDFRLRCKGDVRKYSTGDYVKVETTGGDIHIAGAKCVEARWVK